MKKINLIFIILIVMLLSACSFFGDNGLKSDYVAIIDGEKISVPEFSVYLYEQKNTFEDMGGGEDIWDTDFDGVPAEDVAKENALRSILYVKTACKNADGINVSLDDSDKEEAKRLAAEKLNEIGEAYCSSVGLEEDNTESIMEEILLQQKVMSSITESYQISEADYSAYIDKYIKDHPEDKTPKTLLSQNLRDSYVESKKAEIYNNQIAKWSENITTEKNETLWNEISIHDFEK